MKIKALLATLLLAVLPLAYCSAQAIYDIVTYVQIDPQGNAQIFQKWDVEVVSGTEWYIPIGNLGNRFVHSLSVVELDPDSEEIIAQFESDGTGWDSKRSRKEKAFRCGIVDKGSSGVELCWGQGDFGRHCWVIEYYVDNLVEGYTDADGFNYQFVNDELIALPQHISLIVSNVPGLDASLDDIIEFSPEDTKFWGFGFKGRSEIDEGVIYFESDGPFQSESWSVIIMCRFEKGRFSPEYTYDYSFDKVEEKALKGASFDDDKEDETSFWVLLGTIIAAILGYGLWKNIQVKSGRKYNKKLLGGTRVDGWYRDVPLDGNLPAALWVLENSDRFTSEKKDYSKNIIGAYFLKWIFGKNLLVQEEKAGKDSKNLVLSEAPSGDASQMALWQFMQQAAGEDRILQSREFDAWARRNRLTFTAWLDGQKSSGQNYLAGKGYISGSKGTDTGTVEMRHLLEMKNFLSDYTLIGERSSQEVGLWKDYLVYAQMFGIADKVASEFKKLYPNVYEQVSNEVGGNLMNTIIWTNRYSNHVYTSGLYTPPSSTGSSRSGGGGFTSIGGGGGFSGGGHGGGSR